MELFNIPDFYIEVIGWIGSFLYILSYFLISFDYLKVNKLYYLLNILAAAFVIVISLYKQTIQPIAINSIWLYISFLGYNNKKISFIFFHKKFLHIVSFIFLAVIIISFFYSYKQAFNVLAWFSVFSFSFSYFLFSIQRISEKLFHIYNFLAAMSLIPKMYMYDNMQVVVLESLWAFFAIKAYLAESKDNSYVALSS